jgi:hypothetical protein
MVAKPEFHIGYGELDDGEVKLGHDEILCGYCLQNKIPKGQVACSACQSGFEQLKKII